MAGISPKWRIFLNYEKFIFLCCSNYKEFATTVGAYIPSHNKYKYSSIEYCNMNIAALLLTIQTNIPVNKLHSIK